jgi:prepilin-type N-terminal cleavage/methylation domain-containing protein/prepilin-type processing-associated H-X9-DG protein
MQPNRHRAGFTVIELLVVVAVIAIIAGLLSPAIQQGMFKARRSACCANLRQIGLAFNLYADDHSGRYPDQRYLKWSLPGGYRPWTTWPPSDPRSGWAAIVLHKYCLETKVWRCPSTWASRLKNAIQCVQSTATPVQASATYWLWRFDRGEVDIPLDNCWNKTGEQIVADLNLANNPQVGMPSGPEEVELAVDVYFPATIPAVPDEFRGLAAHSRGRTRLFLDGHVSFHRDLRVR